MFIVGTTHTFEQLAHAINAGFARWDLSVPTPARASRRLADRLPDDSYAPDVVWHDHAKLKVVREVRPGEEFEYVFDLGDDWQHCCSVADAKIDPLEAYGIVPPRPVAIFGWGSIPDQYRRGSEPHIDDPA